MKFVYVFVCLYEGMGDLIFLKIFVGLKASAKIFLALLLIDNFFRC